VARCSICHVRLQPTDPVTTCPECRQAYHRECWDSVGGCATYGCAAAPVVAKPPPPPVVGGGWGDEKTCPACRGTIASSLLVCRCGASFPHADPLTAEEYGAWQEDEARRKASRRTLLLLFLFSLLALPAPVLGAVAGVYAWRRRKELAGADGTYLAIGYGAAVLGALYAVLFLLLLGGA
jgi:hypothetical protein